MRNSPTPAVPHEDELRVLLAEYAEIKAEQRDRITERGRLVPVTLTAVGAIAAGSFSTPPGRTLLLLVPLACFILGWTRLSHDAHVGEQARYLREVLSRRAAELSGGRGFGWETHRLLDPRWRQRRRVQLAADLATYTVPAVVAVAVYAASGPVPGWVWPVGAVELWVVGVLVWQIVAHRR